MMNTAQAIQRINPSELFDGEAYGMSQGTVDPRSNLLYLSGQVSWNPSGQVCGDGYEEQTRLALRNLRVALRAAGSGLQDVLRVRIYVRGELEEHMEQVAPVVAEFFEGARPAVTGVGVTSLATRDTLVEIEAVARVSV